MHPQSRTKAPPPLGHAIGFDANLSYNPVYDDGAIDTLAVCHKLAVATTMKPEEQQALAVDNNSLRMGEATRTLTGDHESRVSGTGTSIVQPAVCKTLSAEGYDGMPDPVKQNGMPIVSILTGHSQANGSNVSECGAAYTVASDGQAAAMCVDAYNQSATNESCMTLRSAMTGTDGNDADPKVVQSAGFMIGPSAKTGSIGAQVEESPTLDTNGTKGVAIGFKGGQSANGGLGDEVEYAPTLTRCLPGIEPTVAIKTEDADAMAFIPYGSRLGADLNGIAKTITAIDAKFPQCVGIDQQGGKSSAATADDISPTMLSDSHGTPNAVATYIQKETNNANATEANPGKVLRDLREALGEKAFEEWKTRVSAPLWTEDVLRLGVLQEGETPAQGKPIVDDGALPCEEDDSTGTMRDVRAGECDGCASSGREYEQQHEGEPRAAMQELPHEDSSPKEKMQDLWCSDEGSRILREALSALQEIRRSASVEAQPVRPLALNHIVRRLTPGEAETLQGFPRDWTKIPYRNKPADQCPDSPRFRGLGNSWATNCAEWILRRIVAADRLGLIP